MNLIKIVALLSGAHENRNSPWETTIPDGWAIIPKKHNNSKKLPVR